MGGEWKIESGRAVELLTQARKLAGMGVWELDIASGRYAWSEEVFQIHGIEGTTPPPEAEWLALYTPESQTRIRSALSRCQDAHEPFELQAELRGSDGAHRWVKATGQPLLRDGRAIGLYGILQDVTIPQQRSAWISRQRALSRAIVQAQKQFIRGVDDQTLFAELLDDVLEVVGAQAGFICVTPYNTSNPRHLVPIAFRKASHVSPAAESLRPLAELIRQRESEPDKLITMLAGAPKSDPERGLTLPVNVDGETVGLLALAQFAAPIDQDQRELLDLLLLSIGQLLVAVRERQALNRSQSDLRLYGQVFENTFNGVAIIDRYNRVLVINPAYEKITGYSQKECLGKPPSVMRFQRGEDSVHNTIWDQLARTGHWDGEVYTCRKNGERFPAKLTLSAVEDEHGHLLNYLLIVSERSGRDSREEAIRRAQRFDALTGLGTRQVLIEKMETRIKQAPGAPFLVAVLDLDGFRALNEVLGPLQGDRVLVETAQRLESCIAPEEIVVRLSGDEFGVFLEGKHIERVAELQRAVVAIAPHAKDAHTLSASLGYTCYPTDRAPAEVLLRHAYQAMHEVKNLGGDGFGQFNLDEYQHQLNASRKLKRLTRALQANEFTLYFQPQVDMLTDAVIGAETLIRWDHPDNGIIAPAHFLPAIAGQALEIEVGEWVLRSAVAQLDRWQQEGLNLTLAVNISPAHLLNRHFLELIKQILADYPNVPARRLQLEVVESAALRDMDAAVEVMSACHDLGCNSRSMISARATHH